jgi:hypothetical protein
VWKWLLHLLHARIAEHLNRPPVLEHPTLGPYCEVPLSGGFVAWVTPEDYWRVAPYRWSVTHNGRRGLTPKSYAKARVPGTKQYMYMHRLIMEPGHGLVVDHFHDPSGLNNIRANLRVCTQEENTRHTRFQKKKVEPWL